MNVDVAWSPTWELLLSLNAFAERKAQSLLDVGSGWLRQVRQQLPPVFVREIATTHEGELGRQLELISGVLALQASDELDAPGFVEWMGGLPVGELYERIAPTVPAAGPALPRDLGAVRDRLHALLRRWHDDYFKGVDPALFVGLAAERDACARLIGTLEPLDLVERVTNGIRLEEPFAALDVTLVPQYHFRPFNESIELHGRLIVCYAADVLPAPDGQPPASVLRATAALADASRLRILRLVAHGTWSLTEITREVGLSQSTVHHHLVALRAAGFTRTHFGGSAHGSASNRYSLRPDGFDRLSQELRSFLTAAPNE